MPFPRSSCRCSSTLREFHRVCSLPNLTGFTTVGALMEPDRAFRAASGQGDFPGLRTRT